MVRELISHRRRHVIQNLALFHPHELILVLLREVVERSGLLYARHSVGRPVRPLLSGFRRRHEWSGCTYIQFLIARSLSFTSRSLPFMPMSIADMTPATAPSIMMVNIYATTAAIRSTSVLPLPSRALST